jgi:ankyrin repeat protein
MLEKAKYNLNIYKNHLRDEHYDMIKSKYMVYQYDSVGLTPLHLAVKCNLYEMAALLLNHDSDVNTIDLYSRTALLIAVKNNNPEMVKLLLDYGSKTKLGRNCFEVNKECLNQTKMKIKDVKNKMIFNRVFIVDDNKDQSPIAVCLKYEYN